MAPQNQTYYSKRLMIATQKKQHQCWFRKNSNNCLDDRGARGKTAARVSCDVTFNPCVCDKLKHKLILKSELCLSAIFVVFVPLM